MTCDHRSKEIKIAHKSDISDTKGEASSGLNNKSVVCPFWEIVKKVTYKRLQLENQLIRSREIK